MCVKLDKHIEYEQDDTSRPSQGPEQPALWRAVEAGNGEEAVRHEVTHQDQVYHAPEDEPRVVLNGRFFELVVLGDLGLHLAFDELVQRGMRVVARFRVLKDARILRPQNKAIVLGLAIEKPANACIVGGSPEEEYDCKGGYAGAFGQYVEGEDQASEYSEDDQVGYVLGLRGRKKLRDHIMSVRHDENCVVTVSICMT